MARVKATHRLATQEELAVYADPSQVAGLKPAQEVGDLPEVGVNFSDSNLEREIEENEGGEEDLSTDLEVEFDVSSEPQILNQTDANRICHTYRILETIYNRLVREGKDPARPSVGEVALSERFFECGPNIPLSLYF